MFVGSSEGKTDSAGDAVKMEEGEEFMELEELESICDSLLVRGRQT